MRWHDLVGHLKAHPLDAFWYVQGWCRYLVYRRWPWLLGSRLIAEVKARQQAADGCYQLGSCRCCGCPTPALFWADKGCRAGAPDAPPHCAGIPPCYRARGLARLFSSSRS